MVEILFFPSAAEPNLLVVQCLGGMSGRGVGGPSLAFGHVPPAESTRNLTKPSPVK